MSIRPPAGYTSRLKQQLAHATDKTPARYEEDHFISLESGGHPRVRATSGPSAGAHRRTRSRPGAPSHPTWSGPRARTPWGERAPASYREGERGWEAKRR
jgi:hypothetical protein